MYHRKDDPNKLTQITVPIRFQFKNIGHTPASFVTALAAFRKLSSVADLVSAQRQLCDVPTSGDHPGQSVFPDQTIPFDVAIIDWSGTNEPILHPSIDTLFLGQDFLEDAYILSGQLVLDEVLVGCVLYKSPSYNEIGKSGFACRLLHRGLLPGLQKGPRGIILKGDHITKDSAVLEPLGYANLFFAE